MNFEFFLPLFSYTAKTNAGETKIGTQEAASENEIAHSLRENGLVPTSIRQISPTDKPLRLKLKNRLRGIFGVPLTEKMMFARHLAVMIGAGLSITRALEALGQQTRNKTFAKAIEDIDVSVQKGMTLADSLARHPACFSELFVNMIRVGEASGNLENILKILARQMEKEHELKSKVRGAMVYPLVIIGAMIGIGILMMIVVVPKLTQIFKEMNADLPLSTKFVIATSDFLNQHLIAGLIILAAMILGARFAAKTSRGKFFLDKTILKLPIFGAISQKINSARLSRTLGSLIEGGLPIVQGLQIAAGTMTNCLFRDSLKNVAETVQKGERLSQKMRTFPSLYPPMVAQMVDVGEETGTLGEILFRLADFYEEEVNDITKSMASIIEPLLMIVIGAVVGFFAISMIQPMYSLMNSM